ncbi:MAG: DUF3120 domain-containing protein [Prochloron sp. SP5CPC1]|nr:DUF3120 domain-containing protein [Candidatus Paraprochloron terpiosi SP5CPC1]
MKAIVFFPPTFTAPNYVPKSSNWKRNKILVFSAAAFLVSVPVFIEAPLVRWLPSLSLLLTFGWVWLGVRLYQGTHTKLWGDLLLGFSWSWLAGSIYWGWFRWEPLLHLPIEAIGLPFVLWCLWCRWGMVGNLFYLGSLFGTAITDLYFYLTGLIPHWRELMTVDPALATPILQDAIAQIQTPWGISWGIVLTNLLLGVSWMALQKRENHWWVFAGAVLTTILVDSLFYLAVLLF